MHPPTVWQALQSPRYVLSSWPWRAALYLLSSVAVGVTAFTWLLLLAVAGSLLAVALIGIPLLLMLALSGIPLAALERRRLLLIDSTVLVSPHREPEGTGPTAWARIRFKEQSTWRELGYGVLFACVLWPLEGLAVGTVITVCGGLLSTPFVMFMVEAAAKRPGFSRSGWPTRIRKRSVRRSPERCCCRCSLIHWALWPPGGPC